MPVLQFKGKTAVETYHYTVPHHTLEFTKKLSCVPEGEEPSLDGNLIIEGDNLLALKALLPTHAGSVKCIYMDPPYNKGEEKWVYNDNLTQPQFKEWIGQTVGKEGEDACRHDKWCCMMYPRLMVLKDLLTSDGVMFVSIDDTEIQHLELLMDEVFGPDNHLGTVVWKTRNTDNRLKSNLSVDHEYLVIYSMNASPLLGRVINRGDFKNPDNDPRGPWVSDPLTGKATADARENLHFTITNPDTGDEYPPDPSRGWITDPDGIQEIIDDKRMWWPPDPATGKPRKKRFLSETSERMPASTFWSDLKGQSGADEVDQILGKRLFDFPKSVQFIRRIIDYAVGPSDIVLDPTGGSGTTAHAILEANALDNGSRRFILIQQPHDTKDQAKAKINICREVLATRVRRVISGYPTQGTKRETLYEHRLTLNSLSDCGSICETLDRLKAERAGDYDEVKASCSKGVVKVEGINHLSEKSKPLKGGFSFATLSSEPLLGEYRDLGETLPSYKDIAKYVFYTETSMAWENGQADKTSGKIGEHGDTSYYLLYKPNRKTDWAVDMDFLNNVAANDPNKRLVVYCEKIWVHQHDRKQWEAEYSKSVRLMLVPFNLK